VALCKENRGGRSRERASDGYANARFSTFKIDEARDFPAGGSWRPNVWHYSTRTRSRVEGSAEGVGELSIDPAK
jgi:hypothetical protein